MNVEKNDTMAPNADDAINKELVNLISLDKFNVGVACLSLMVSVAAVWKNFHVLKSHRKVTLQVKIGVFVSGVWMCIASKWCGSQKILCSCENEGKMEVPLKFLAELVKGNPQKPKAIISMKMFWWILMLEIFPKINKVVFLDDDIVVQKNLSCLCSIDLKIEQVKPIVVVVMEKSLGFVVHCLESFVGDELRFI
nr:probable galacturonosyltransferase 4 [Tanacetum cinerariifolium]